MHVSRTAVAGACSEAALATASVTGCSKRETSHTCKPQRFDDESLASLAQLEGIRSYGLRACCNALRFGFVTWVLRPVELQRETNYAITRSAGFLDSACAPGRPAAAGSGVSR